MGPAAPKLRRSEGGNGIVPVAAERMAPHQAADRECPAAQDAVLLHSFKRIRRA